MNVLTNNHGKLSYNVWRVKIRSYILMPLLWWDGVHYIFSSAVTLQTISPVLFFFSCSYLTNISQVISCLKTRYLCSLLQHFFFYMFFNYKYCPYKPALCIVLWANAHCFRRAAWVALQEQNLIGWSDGWVWSQTSWQQWRGESRKGSRNWSITGPKVFGCGQWAASGASSLLVVPALCGGWDVLCRGMVINRKGESIKEIHLGSFCRKCSG